MSEINEYQVKMALKVAKDLSAGPNLQLYDADIRRVDLLERSQVGTNQRALESLYISYLTKTGFEVDRFEKICEQHQTELCRIVEEQKADAIKHSSYTIEAFRRGADSRRDAVLELAVPPTYEILRSPFLIWPSQGLDISEEHVEPSKSRVKFRIFSDGASGREAVGFYFLWQNPSHRRAVINVDSYLAVNGFCTAASGPGIVYDFDRTSSIGVSANLTLWQWWDQPPSLPMFQAGQLNSVGGIVARPTFIGPDLGSVQSMTLSSAHDLRYEKCLIEADGIVVFVVTLVISYQAGHGGLGSLGNGYVDIDFASGDFQVMCPDVLVTVLT